MKTGRDLVNEALKHIGEKYILGSVAPKNNPNYKGPWDCAEFLSWVVKQVSYIEIGTRNGDAYTGFWHEDVSTKCRIIDLNQAAGIVGAVLLRKPRKKLIGHIVLSLGNGRTIEAMNKINGVKSGSVHKRDWDMGLLLNGISYEEEVSPIIIEEPIYLFKFDNPLMQDPKIAAIKAILREKGFFYGIDNDLFDEELEMAVHNYQIKKGLVVDGIVGRQTLKSLKIIS